MGTKSCRMRLKNRRKQAGIHGMEFYSFVIKCKYFLTKSWRMRLKNRRKQAGIHGMEFYSFVNANKLIYSYQVMPHVIENPPKAGRNPRHGILQFRKCKYFHVK